MPASDKGNASYADRGRRGSYSPKEFAPFTEYPEGVKFETGFGADEADIEAKLAPGAAPTQGTPAHGVESREKLVDAGWSEPREELAVPLPERLKAEAETTAA